MAISLTPLEAELYIIYLNLYPPGVTCLTQIIRGAEDRITNPAVSGEPALLPEPHLGS